MSDQEIVFAAEQQGRQELSPPAYFLSLTVENFRCFKERQTLDLSDGKGRPARWTVILGENGVGKTTLLQCLAALMPYKGFVDYIGPASLGAQINPVMGNWIRELSDGSEAPLISLHLIEGINLDNLNALMRFRSEIKKIISYDGKPGLFYSAYQGRARYVNCFAYGANRTQGKSIISDAGVYDQFQTLFSSEATLISAEEWLLRADYSARLSDAVNLSIYRDKVVGVLIRLLPDISHIRVGSSHLDKPMKDLHMEALTPYGWVPFRSLSLGYQTLITWTVDLAARLFDRYPDSPDPLAEPAIVLVDEIDLHLHPKWQRELIGFLSNIFKQTQFIVTAHSPLVVQAAEDANIVVLHREGDQVVIENNPESVRNWRVDQILASELFGQVPTRSPGIDRRMEERTALLSKPTLTEEDRQRLAVLEAEIGTLPTAENQEDREAMDIIRRAAELLKRNGAANGAS